MPLTQLSRETLRRQIGIDCHTLNMGRPVKVYKACVTKNGRDVCAEFGIHPLGNWRSTLESAYEHASLILGVRANDPTLRVRYQIDRTV